MVCLGGELREQSEGPGDCNAETANPSYIIEVISVPLEASRECLCPPTPVLRQRAALSCACLHAEQLLPPGDPCHRVGDTGTGEGVKACRGQARHSCGQKGG